MPEHKNNDTPTLMHAEPVLAVKDISETVLYWHEVLGFPNKWTWGEPPNHGGVSWQGVFIQFTHNPALADASRGNCIWINVRQLPALYEFHQKNKVEIVDPIKNKPWGVAEYTIKEINGYYIVFAGALLSESKKGSNTISPTVRIRARMPTAEEYMELAGAVAGGDPPGNDYIEKVLAAPLYAVVAEDETSNKIIGSAFLLGDHASFFYVKDVMVHPDWQHKQVGSAMMKKLTDWLDDNAPANAYVALIAPESLAPFYKQFDFTPVFGMYRSIKPK